jgi:Uma2 family endonuclease
MTTALRWTTADLDLFPERLDDTRYEIIDGELHVSRQPNVRHQYTCGQIHDLLNRWSRATGAGFAIFAPGVLFADDEAVAPDVVWVSAERLGHILGADGKLHAAPEIVVEALSPGASNEQRDREAKLRLYSRQDVQEYWVLDWQQRLVDVYRRNPQDNPQDRAALRHVATLEADDFLDSPLRQGFSCRVADLFFPEPRG